MRTKLQEVTNQRIREHGSNNSLNLENDSILSHKDSIASLHMEIFGDDWQELGEVIDKKVNKVLNLVSKVLFSEALAEYQEKLYGREFVEQLGNCANIDISN